MAPLFFIESKVFLIAALVSVVTGTETMCPNGKLTFVPPHVSHSDEYPFAEAGMQIFTNLQMPCVGTVNMFSFKPVTDYVLQLHIGVFRLKDEFTYSLIGENYIDLYKTPEAKGPHGWITYTANPPINVQKGDVIGIFYDKYSSTFGLLSIASQTLFDGEHKDVNPTYVFVADNGTIGRANGDMNIRKAVRSYRVPALRAVVGPRSLDIHWPIVTPAPRPAPSPPPPSPPPPPPLPRPPPPPQSPVEPPLVEPSRLPREPLQASLLTFSGSGSGFNNDFTVPPPESLSTEPIYHELVTTETPSSTQTTTQVTQKTTQTIQTAAPSQVASTLPLPIDPTQINPRCLGSATSALFCDNRSVRAFYDYTIASCREYYGCPAVRPGGNNFDSMNECNTICSRLPQDNCKKIPSALESCAYMSRRFFYNPYLQACSTFYGCSLGGYPGNNFDTLDECNLCKGDAVLSPLEPDGGRIVSRNVPAGLPAGLRPIE